MPGIEDWLNNPLDIIQGLYRTVGHHGPDFSSEVKEYFEKRLAERNALCWVPSLNDTPLHDLKPNSLVKFRCMIQDMFDPEFYLSAYETVDVKTGESFMKNGQYKDIAQCLPHQKINVDSQRNTTADRQTYYCVPIPGEAQWCKEGYQSASQAKVSPSSSCKPVRCKRSLEDDDQNMKDSEELSEAMGVASTSSGSQSNSTETKRSRTEDTAVQPSNPSINLNFPLSGETGPACLVKIYESGDPYKVNDILEFVGVLSIDPAMANFKEESPEHPLLQDQAMDVEEESVHHPPPSLVPRLHVITAYKLQHCNPHLPVNIEDQNNKEFVNSILQEAQSIRSHITSALELALFGDALAVEYLLCNLISSVYARRDVVAVGKFCLNLSGCPRESSFPQRLYQLIKELTTKSHMLPMSLENMNTLAFCPKKDYTANRLCSGVLQLAERTNLILDETALEPGQLDANGVKNLTALGNVINWQKVEYDFNFHHQDFQCNIVPIILSEGKSLLPSDSHVPLQPTTPSDKIEENFSAIASYLTPALLTKLRTYLGLVQLLDYTIKEDIQKSLEEDFVNMRRLNANGMKVEDFHSLLVLARLLSLSYGQTELTREMWNKAKTLEQQRKQRLPSQ